MDAFKIDNHHAKRVIPPAISLPSCEQFYSDSTKDEDFSLARFARGRRDRRERKNLFSGLYLKGALTLRSLRALREKIIWIFVVNVLSVFIRVHPCLSVSHSVFGL